MELEGFFDRYRTLPTEDACKQALAQFVELTRPIQKCAPKPERMARFMASCGHPEQRLRVIHIAGTSGKGSTTTFISTLLHAHGFHVGMTISPHVREVRERIQIDGTPIAEADFRALLEEGFAALARSFERGEEILHFFEFITALALIWFARKHVDYAVIETGLGGKFDATNVLRSGHKFCVFTPIDLDHQRLLGNTPAEIAKEKSGIMVEGGMVLSAPQHESVQQVLSEEARNHHAVLRYVRLVSPKDITLDRNNTTFSYERGGEVWSKIILNAIGLHQAQNAVVALDAVGMLASRDGWVLSEVIARRALQAVALPARFEIRSIQDRVVIIDVAHNPQKMESLLQTVQTLFPDQPLQLLLGLNGLEHAAPLARIIKRYQAQVILAGIEVGDVYQRYLLADVNELGQIFQEEGIVVTITHDLEETFSRLSSTAPETLTVICGSFYLVSYALPILDNLC